MENADAPCESPTQTQNPGPKDRVAEEAARRFLARGYQAVGLREISTALNLQAATLYHHFPGGKSQLYVESVCAHLATVQAQLTELATAQDSLSDALQTMADWLWDSPSLDLQRVLAVDRAALRSTEAQEMLSGAVEHAFILPFQAACGAARARDELRGDVDPQLLAAAALAIAQHVGAELGPGGRAAMQTALVFLVRGATTTAYRFGRSRTMGR